MLPQYMVKPQEHEILRKVSSQKSCITLPLAGPPDPVLL